MKRILIIEDDEDIVELVRYNLEKEGFQVFSEEDGLNGLARAKKSPPDLLVLDLMLPRLLGLEICKELRRSEKVERMPILMLTARGDEADRVLGLELGADDYVAKPFSPRELVARVKALLRRSDAGARSFDSAIEVAGVQVDPSSYRVTRAGQIDQPEHTGISACCTSWHCRPNRVFSRDQLLDAVWGNERFRDPQERGCVYPSPPGQARIRPGAATASQDGSRSRVPVGDQWELNSSGSLLCSTWCCSAWF